MTNPIRAIMGLDFGTASTKVIISTPYEYGQKAYIVDFNELYPTIEFFLLPSQIYLDKFGQIKITPFPKSEVHHTLKGQLLRQFYTNDQNKELMLTKDICKYAIAFLANVFIYSRDWFQKVLTNEFGHEVIIKWDLNLGIPSNGLDHDGLENLFQAIGQIAWWVSKNQKDININFIEKILADQDILNSEITKKSINIYPEVGAEINGYAKSEFRQDGLHLLIDIGASTLDISCFNLFNRDGEDHISVFYAEIYELGTIHLCRFRQKKVVFNLLHWYYQQMENIKPFLPVPDNISEYCPPAIYQEGMNLHNLEVQFKEDCTKVIKNMIFTAKKNKIPHKKDWEYPKTFICGGGSFVQFYKDTLDDCNYSVKTQILDSHGLDIRGLMIPPKLVSDNITDQDYQRLAVAFGLCFPVEDLPKFKPQSKVNNFEVPISKKYDNTLKYYDKDMV